ncbi:MAG: alpha/beta hydrolase-fold protein [Chitinophagales bacterium]
MKKLLPFFFLLIIQTTAFAQQFKVSYSPAVFNKPFTGKIILYLNKENKTPKDGAVDIEPFPCFSIDVKNVQPGSSVVFDDKADSYPAKLSDIERSEYYVQAVWDRDLGGRAISESPGNIYSKTAKVALTKDINKTFTLVCDQVIPEPVFRETDFVKELKAPSSLLSAFHKKTMTVNAAVILPEDYFKEPQKKFPVQFIVSGYGGDYHRYSGDTTPSHPIDSIHCITVFLDGDCSLGHSVYANSDNNGPWGDALTKEFIPLLESKYRCNGARLLRGHSSGGWTVLWLQTHYPAVFTACWSSSPDPVDFRDFQKINLYADDNMYYDKDSSLRSVATVAGFFPWASAKQACQQEYVIYRGEQMHSFDAVFSEKGTNGNPLRICDPVTGELNRKSFEHWKQYDISLYLRTNWTSLKNDLEGKIRVSVGEQDNFLLNGAVHLLDNEMKKLGTKFVFAYYPGDHFTVGTPEYRAAGMQFLAKKYIEWEENNKKGF